MTEQAPPGLGKKVSPSPRSLWLNKLSVHGQSRVVSFLDHRSLVPKPTRDKASWPGNVRGVKWSTSTSSFAFLKPTTPIKVLRSCAVRSRDCSAQGASPITASYVPSITDVCEEVFVAALSYASNKLRIAILSRRPTTENSDLRFLWSTVLPQTRQQLFTKLRRDSMMHRQHAAPQALAYYIHVLPSFPAHYTLRTTPTRSQKSCDLFLQSDWYRLFRGAGCRQLLNMNVPGPTRLIACWPGNEAKSASWKHKISQIDIVWICTHLLLHAHSSLSCGYSSPSMHGW